MGNTQYFEALHYKYLCSLMLKVMQSQEIISQKLSFIIQYVFRFCCSISISLCNAVKIILSLCTAAVQLLCFMYCCLIIMLLCTVVQSICRCVLLLRIFLNTAFRQHLIAGGDDLRLSNIFHDFCIILKKAPCSKCKSCIIFIYGINNILISSQVRLLNYLS